MDYLNFLFEIEGEFPIFVAIRNDGRRSIKEMLTEAYNEAVDIYDAPAREIKYLGCYDNEDAETLGWDTY